MSHFGIGARQPTPNAKMAATNAKRFIRSTPSRLNDETAECQMATVTHNRAPDC
jgi:hypothetical protein